MLTALLNTTDVFPGAVRFPEAEQQLAQKLPTVWSEFNKANYDRSFVSAGVESARELQFWKDACTQIIEGRGNAGENRVLFNQMFQDSILNARARQDLLVSTNIEMARGYGQMVRQLDPDLVDAYPAWELVRNDFRLHPRGDPSYKPGTDGAVDWEERWGDALAEAGSDDEKAVFENTGRMIALKDSDVWQALGDGAGGRQDTLGNPYEPFAFNSAMGRKEIDRDECEGLGLLKPNEQVDPPELPGFNDSFEQDPGVDEDLLGELVELLTGIVAVKDGVLSIL